MSRLLLVAALLLAVGCAPREVVLNPPEPVPEDCPAQCRQPCDFQARFHPDPDTDDALGELVDQVLVPLRTALDACDLRREVCVQCLDRLRRAGVTR